VGVALWSCAVIVVGAEGTTVDVASAKAYCQWVVSCADAVEKDLPAISASADAAAAKYVKDDYELGVFGDEGVVGELYGRSGGMMRLSVDNHSAPVPLNDPRLKCVVLVTLREDNLDATVAKAKEFMRHGNKMLVAIGRRDLVEKAKSGGVAFDAAFDSHAAPHGGLFPNARGKWMIATDPVASMIVAWTWTGEFVAACTRLGKMPPVYQGFAVPGGVERAKKIGSIKFHEATPKPVPAGSVGRQYLAAQKSDLAALLKDEETKVRQVAELAARTGQAGKAVYCFVHGHALLRHVPFPPNDPGFFKRANRSWFDLEPGFQLSAGDFVFCVGFDTVFQGKQWGDFAENARKAGAKLAWSLATYRTDDIKTIPAGELLVDQHWAFGDAVAAVDGYDVKILPTGGVQGEVAYWMVNAEMLQLLGR
jgi:hypothetical protein